MLRCEEFFTNAADGHAILRIEPARRSDQSASFDATIEANDIVIANVEVTLRQMLASDLSCTNVVLSAGAVDDNPFGGLA